MIWFYTAVAQASVVGIKCPHCGHVQARARQRKESSMRCRSCFKEFSRAEVEAQYAQSKRCAKW